VKYLLIEQSKERNLTWKRILLIKPNYRVVNTDIHFAQFNAPPLSLFYIASYLSDLEVDIEILDAKVKNLSYKQIIKKIKKFNPDIVGISVFVSAVIYICFDLAKIIKKINPNCIIVFGNQHPTAEPEETLKIDEVDIVVRGEGELTFRELIINGTPENVDGISYKSDGKIVHNPDRPLDKDFGKVRYPVRHFTKNNKYKTLSLNIEKVEASRGCPYRCKFCTTPNFTKSLWRPRPIKSVITELKIISQNRRITDILFVDDHFTEDTKRIENLCDKIIEYKKRKEINDFKFIAQGRADSIVESPQMVKKMAEAGFWVFAVGIESFSNKTLKDMRKNLEFKKSLRAIKILHDNNIIIIGNLLLGYDLNATEEEIKNQMKFIKKLNIDVVDYKILTPFPGTEIRKELAKENLILSNDWTKYTFITPVIKTHKLSPKKLHQLYCYSFKEIKYLNNWKGIASRIIKTRGLLFLLNPIRIISWIKSFISIKSILKTIST